MTKRRPSNKKPTGVNKSLGNCLKNERESTRRSHQKAKWDGNEIENPAFLEKEIKKNIDSITDETSLEEFLAKAELAGTEFSAEREAFHVIDKDSRVVVPTKKDLKDNIELQQQYAHRLKVPRRPTRDLWNDVDELARLENEVFLRWRTDLADLQEVDGLALTPFERNPEMWRELWRVVERSDIIVQIVDARNPLLFRSKDLDLYVKEVDPAKQILLLVNKADLLEPEQQKQWAQYFNDNNINVVFWSALDETVKPIEEEIEDMDMDGSDSEGSSAADEIPQTVGNETDTSSGDGVDYVRHPEDLIALLKKLGHVSDVPGSKQLVVGMVGYPNVGKSSTINKLAGGKKVSVSATPGKTRHFQTINIDSQLVLCDCPGLVMPSFSFGRNEMFLNGILPVDQMREHFGPAALLLSRVPVEFLEATYSVMLPQREIPSALDLLTSVAFMRGFMSSSGIPDCSRAARMIMKDVVSGKVRWVAAPPGIDQSVFDELLYSSKKKNERIGLVQLEQLERRGLLCGDDTANTRMDSSFFSGADSVAHVKTANSVSLAKQGVSDAPSNTAIPQAQGDKGSKKHFNHGKKKKLRNMYPGMYA